MHVKRAQPTPSAIRAYLELQIHTSWSSEQEASWKNAGKGLHIEVVQAPHRTLSRSHLYIVWRLMNVPLHQSSPDGQLCERHILACTTRNHVSGIRRHPGDRHLEDADQDRVSCPPPETLKTIWDFFRPSWKFMDPLRSLRTPATSWDCKPGKQSLAACSTSWQLPP